MIEMTATDAAPPRIHCLALQPFQGILPEIAVDPSHRDLKNSVTHDSGINAARLIIYQWISKSIGARPAHASTPNRAVR